MLIMALLLTGIILACVTDMKYIKEPLYKSLKDYDPDSSSSEDKALVQAWDQTQRDLQCCGVEAWIDWPRCNDNFGSTTGQCEMLDEYK